LKQPAQRVRRWHYITAGRWVPRPLRSSHQSTAMALPVQMSAPLTNTILSTYTKIFLYPTLEFAQCRMLWDDDLLRPEARHKNGLRANATEVGVQRRCDSSKG